MAEPPWQELLRTRLLERDARECAFAPIIEQCAFSFPSYSNGVLTFCMSRQIAGWHNRQSCSGKETLPSCALAIPYEEIPVVQLSLYRGQTAKSELL